jgi:uncharacterized membrane protein YgcG
VINEVIVPRIQAGQRDEAVTAAINSLTGVIDKQSDALPPVTPPAQSAPLGGLRSIFYGILGILILGLLITHPRLALYFLTTILSGGGGTVRGGGGGFGGGGGRSGGGGASGSW